MSCNEVFAKRIKELRESRNLTMRGLAAELNIGNNSISQYENCLRTPDIDVLKKFADYFGVTCDYLVGLSDESSKR